MNPVEQGLLYATSVIVLVGTLVVFVWQLVRHKNDD